MKSNNPNEREIQAVKLSNSSVGQELKRNIWIVSSLLAIILMIVCWKEFALPELASAFTSSHPSPYVENLLMIVGGLASLCITLTVVMIAILFKMYSLSKKIAVVEGIMVVPEVSEMSSEALLAENKEDIVIPVETKNIGESKLDS